MCVCLYRCMCVNLCVRLLVCVCLCVFHLQLFMFGLVLCSRFDSAVNPCLWAAPLLPLTSHPPPSPLHTALLSRCYPLDRNMLNLCCALLLLFIILTHFPYLLHPPLHSPLLMDYSIALHSAPVLVVVVVMSVAQFVCIYHSHSGSVCVDGD